MDEDFAENRIILSTSIVSFSRKVISLTYLLQRCRRKNPGVTLTDGTAECHREGRAAKKSAPTSSVSSEIALSFLWRENYFILLAFSNGTAMNVNIKHSVC